MEYTELLYDFVDGTTDVAQEQTLFMALASHEDLRADLKQLLAMKTAVQNDSKAFNPPAESTLALFSTLGFTAPQMVNPSTAKASLASRSAKFIGGASSAIATGLIMSSITALSMYFLMSNRAENSTVKIAERTNINTPAALAGMSQSNSSNTAVETIRTVTLPPKEIIKYIYVTVPAVQSNAAAILPTNRNSESESSVETTEQSYPPVMTTDVRTLALSQSTPSNNSGWKQLDYDAELMPSPIDKTPASNISRWALELRRIDTRSYTEQTFISKTPDINNLAFTALYSLNSRLSVGIEVAQEQSFQKFTTINGAGRLVLTEQHPTLHSVAGVIRYTPIELGKFQPIIQASGGGSEIGAFGRGLVGVQYFPETFLSFVIGAEANIQRFTNGQNLVFTTSKYGLSYGMSFHF
ncbi:MAG: hypothetical protein HYZ54_01555 [Ignavibacteriae bacterium]|nr:hypothetical protein [Ignavibacteriota bacterium]